MNYFANGDIRKGDGLEIAQAAGFSLANLVSFLPIRKEAFGEAFLNGLTPLAHVVATGQMLLGLTLLFLIGLALRNRFRMK